MAKKAHEGQKDKAGQPYLFHCLRVMLAFDTEEEQICAVLHDTVEDSFFTFEDLQKAGISQTVLLALDALTKRKNECYEIYIERVLQNKLACKIKLADLEDNMNLKRIDFPTKDDYIRTKKYESAKEKIVLILNECDI